MKKCFSRSKLAGFISGIAFAGVITGCAGGILKYENSDKVLKNDEFDSAIKVKEIPDSAVPVAAPAPKPDAKPGATPEVGKEKPTPKQNAKSKPAPVAKGKSKASEILLAPVADARSKTREPILEDAEGFVGRRPKVDPYRVGEEVVLDVSYFALDAGELTMQTRSFVEVNGRKAYRFHAIAKTVSVFEKFYKVDDYAETLVDFESMLPFSYTLDVKESKLLRDARAVHDVSKGQPGKMQFWDKKITKDNGVEERKLEWDMLPYAQNIFSSLWYLRAFTLTPGKIIKFHLAHENENLTMTCEVVRREKLKTDLGTYDTVVIRPSAEKNGKPHNIGTSLFWLTDDDQKLMIRMETKIKIGSIVGSLAKLRRSSNEPGKDSSKN